MAYKQKTAGKKPRKLSLVQERFKEMLLHDNKAVESYEVDGKVVRIFPDEIAESPRSDTNLGIMALFHNRYTFPNEADIKADDFGGWQEMEKYLVKEKKAVIILPVYLYEHSGLYFKIGSWHGLLPQGHAEFDSGQVGFIYATQKQLDEWYGKISQKEKLKKAEEDFKAEVDTYTQYSNGDIYGFKITDVRTGKDLDSCWGFYGIDEAKEGAKENIK
jgi:hypothetical protein